MAGRSIKIFLIDGSASGLRTAELGLSTIKAMVVPRSSLAIVSKRPEPKKTGVYILIGADTEKLGQKKIYIGEADTILKRLSDHNKDVEKEFWEEAVFFVSKDDNQTKSHARYLEAKLISLAFSAKRATVTNIKNPIEQGWLPEADEIEMDEFIIQARLLLGVLGYDLFEPILTHSANTTINTSVISDSKEFQYSGTSFNAICFVDLEAGQFIVKEGSKAKKNEAAALTPTYKNLRALLISNGVLIETDKHTDIYVFSQDYSFSSITAAAQIVSATPVNGRVAWKTLDNETYADWQNELLLIENKNPA